MYAIIPEKEKSIKVKLRWQKAADTCSSSCIQVSSVTPAGANAAGGLHTEDAALALLLSVSIRANERATICGYTAQFVEMGINIGSLVGAAHIGSKHFIQSCCIDFKAG
ncbi:hypothetical protein VTP01DRAFT_2875 [Rhizomucor pusillus]|uniref:uncharacterized protein n=1 Tax=Rhizomucor pusillus TaxID=4840 RepID=UPI0037437314